MDGETRVTGMPNTDDIILAVIAALIAFFMGRIEKKINKHNAEAEKRQQEAEARQEARQRQLIEQWTAEKCYSDSIGELAIGTVKAIKRAKVCNGELDAPLELAETAKADRAKFYIKANAKMAVEK
jgi:hypothetical protein